MGPSPCYRGWLVPAWSFDRNVAFTMDRSTQLCIFLLPLSAESFSGVDSVGTSGVFGTVNQQFLGIFTFLGLMYISSSFVSSSLSHPRIHMCTITAASTATTVSPSPTPIQCCWRSLRMRGGSDCRSSASTGQSDRVRKAQIDILAKRIRELQLRFAAKRQDAVNMSG